MWPAIRDAHARSTRSLSPDAPARNVAFGAAGLLAACSSNFNPAGGATKPSDGADGACCPPSTGGCAKLGGYREDGECSASPEACDNMCEQRIVDDVHGGKKMVYRNPPVSTTYAGPQSCSDPIFNGGRDAGDAGDTSDASDASDGGDGGDGE
jgi:hypothetical protein